jgi:hypothetical protein
MSILTSLIPGRLLAEVIIVGVLLGTNWITFASWQDSKGALIEYKAEVATLAADQARQVKEREQRAEAHNAQVLQSLQADLDGSSARADSLARRLSAALSRPQPVPQATNQPVPDGPSGGPSGTGETERLLGAALGACTRDSARFSALQAEVAGQL